MCNVHPNAVHRMIQFIQCIQYKFKFIPRVPLTSDSVYCVLESKIDSVKSNRFSNEKKKKLKSVAKMSDGTMQ